MHQIADKLAVRIIADSSCDIFEIPDIDFLTAPLTISTQERKFCDDSYININEMMNYLATYRGRSYTSCPSIEDWLKCYEGADVVYVVTLSSGLSGSYNSASTAADIYRETHPNVKIRVFDSRSAASEVRLIVDKIAEHVKSNKNFEETCDLIDNYSKNIRIFFALESFHNFIQNGRVNKIIGRIAGIFGIRIMATGSPEGKVEIIKKFRGSQNTVNVFLDCVTNAGYNGGKCYIAHCENPILANQIAKKVREKYSTAEIKVYGTRGLCSYYAEKGGIILSCECEKSYK